MPLRLYEFPEAYRLLWESAGSDNDLPPEEEAETLQTLQQQFDDLEVAYAEKAENIAKMIRTLTATQEALDTEAKRLKARSATVKRKVEWLKGYLVESMRELGHKKIEGQVLNVTLTSNHRVEVVGDVPERFQKTDINVSVDVAGIRQALKDGEDVPGATLQETNSIRIR